MVHCAATAASSCRGKAKIILKNGDAMNKIVAGANGVKEIYYPAVDGHIHALFVSQGGSWGHLDLTENAGAPAANNTSMV